MQFIKKYTSPLGNIVLAADEIGLTGLWFEGAKYFPKDLDNPYMFSASDEKSESLFSDAVQWLDIYFSRKIPDWTPTLHFLGTEFQKDIWKILLTIPYGKTKTYRDISLEFEKQKEKRIAFQAIGGAVGRNKISLIVPCHRVIGANGNLIGFAAGIDKKEKLLKMEKDVSN